MLCSKNKFFDQKRNVSHIIQTSSNRYHFLKSLLEINFFFLNSIAKEISQFHYQYLYSFAQFKKK